MHTQVWVTEGETGAGDRQARMGRGGEKSRKQPATSLPLKEADIKAYIFRKAIFPPPMSQIPV